ncbi:acyl-CoA transferase [Paracoccus litorisediminis]|uniref:Acyl-CoA transferase n=1 Tax=Paracoccus litorisediminis TaxID=2006130 RepID=A0A844HSP1_9RHOB|nr:acyl-CoA transferase [Paracoccus litorisediminis]MTH62108.1 acyl-CoA transferase [Paracoccus litorisediminis]
MVESVSEQIMLALFAQVEPVLPFGVKFERNATLPQRVPEVGWVCLRDGDPGPPEVTLSPLVYFYEHDVEFDLVVDLPEDQRDAAFDALKQALGLALADDRTLGGLCDWLEASAPQPVDIPIEGGNSLKAATVTVTVHYATSDPLA